MMVVWMDDEMMDLWWPGVRHFFFLSVRNFFNLEGFTADLKALAHTQRK